MNESALKAFMFNAFIPSVHQVIIDHAADKYKEWQGNCCRQIAVFGSYFIDKYVPSTYIVTAWDGEFDDVILDRPLHYNHAWIFVKDTITKRRLLIDLARTHKENLWIEVPNNRYPKDYQGYENMKETSREQIDWRRLIESETEFYTRLSSKEFINKLSERIFKCY